MKEIPEHFKIDFEPIATTEAVVIGENVRFTLLTSQLLRLEYSPTAKFEDRASQTFWYRKQPVPEFQVIRDNNSIEIITEHLHLSYTGNGKEFSPRTLQIKLLRTGEIWKCSDNIWDYNLHGTARTLDGVNGDVYLDYGLISRNGWSIIDDSKSTVLDEEGWVCSRHDHNNTPYSNKTKDIYFFGYGNEYKKCLKDYCMLTGKPALFPRWVIGNWWSRFHRYTQDELINLMDEFRNRDIPLSVCIVDMDWHIVDNEYNTGWTGYTWNPELFPDPEAFIKIIHKKGLKTGLNLHPADGVNPHEEMYEKFAEYMGIDAESEDPIAFDITDPRFAKGYFKFLHHPHEEKGIDFWWIDWQQGSDTKISGLDPLRWLNHLHFYDMNRNSDRRPFIFSRYAGFGSHRYPIGFSGDTYVTWESLALLPYFTATAANVAFGWWSHDIGGHMAGIEDSELFTRWVQFGVFSPILRLHSTRNPYKDRRPWAFDDDEVYKNIENAMRLRHALIPYIYTMLIRDHKECIPLCTPMYYDNPDDESAYLFKDQYYFGRELLAAPYIAPIDSEIGLSRRVVWLPEGEWYNFFSGEYFKGGKAYAIYGNMSEIPIFAKAGAIVPLDSDAKWGSVGNPSVLEINVFAGDSNNFSLYEDDGETQNYLQGEFCITEFIQEWEDSKLHFTIKPANGDLNIIPAKRTYVIKFYGVGSMVSATVKLNGEELEVTQSYCENSETISLGYITVSPTDCVEVLLSSSSETILSKRDRRVENCRKLLKKIKIDALSKVEIDNMLTNTLSIDFGRLINIKPVHLAALVEIYNNEALSSQLRK